jgi:hypothetical protein
MCLAGDFKRGIEYLPQSLLGPLHRNPYVVIPMGADKAYPENLTHQSPPARTAGKSPRVFKNTSIPLHDSMIMLEWLQFPYQDANREG